MSETHDQLTVEISLSADGSMVVAAYIRLRSAESARTVEFVPDTLIADFDDRDHVIGIEILQPIAMDQLKRVLGDERSLKTVWNTILRHVPQFAKAA